MAVIKNNSMREEPRGQRAQVIPPRQDESLLEWLENSGRFISGEVPGYNFREEAESEELSEYMGAAEPFDFDAEDDDDLVTLDDDD